MIIYRPKEYREILPRNPFKGWVAWGQHLDTLVNDISYNMIYVAVNWAQVEPVKGEFLWEKLEQEWNFAKAVGNIKIILRVILDNPGDHTSGTGIDIPAWLFKEINETGTFYTSNEIGNGFSPDYNNKKLVKRHQVFITEMGKRYNNDPRVAFIQVGSLGHWGEWHTWPKSSGIFPDYKIAEQYINHYLKAFSAKKLIFRRPLHIHHKNKDVGLFNDILGDNNPWGTPAWLSWIRDGYTSGWELEAYLPMHSNWWHHACSGGEFATHEDGVLHWFENSRFAIIIQQVLDSHTSWIGPTSPAHCTASGEVRQKIDDLYKLLGYRFVIEEVVYENLAYKNQNFSIKVTLNNAGVAPFYFDWPFEVTITDKNSNMMLKQLCDNIDIRTFLPGWNECNLSIFIPGTLAAGKYDINFAILDPVTRKPAVDFANDPVIKRPDGRYNYVSIRIVDSE